MKPLPPELIIFDLYGTLVQFGVTHHPFRKLLQWAREQGRLPQADDARKIMTLANNPRDLLSQMSINPPEAMLDQLNNEIQDELDNLKLFSDVIPTLTQLKQQQIPLVVCSNLAMPYGAIIETLLSEFNLIQCLSYKVGFIKPDIEIYQFIVDKTGIAADRCLFVGDTLIADYQGPKQFGFQAKHLIRESQSTDHSIKSLTDILDLYYPPCE